MYKIAYIFDRHTSGKLIKEVQKLLPSNGIAIKLYFFTQHELDAQEPNAHDSDWQTIDKVDFIFLVAHGSISFFKKCDLFWQRYKGNKKIYFHAGIDEELLAFFDNCNITRKEYAEIYKYFEARTIENIYNLSCYLANYYGAKPYKYKKAQMPKWQGILHPKEQSWKQIKASIKKAKQQNKAVIVVLVPYFLVANDNLKHIHKLINSIEEKGAYCYAVFSSFAADEKLGRQGTQYIIDKYLIQDGKALPEAIVNTLAYSLTIFERNQTVTTDSGSIFDQVKLPVIQAFSTYFSRQEWEDSIQGLDAMSLVSAIYYPEFDGQICGYPIASNEFDKELESYIFEPITDRIDLVADMAVNWSILKRTANSDKRIAIIFHNYPASNYRIGTAAGLDSPATVYNVLKALKDKGIYTDYDFEKPDDIIHKIIDTVSNDNTWLSEEEMIERSQDIITSEQYQTWYNDLPEKSHIQIEKDWGKAPGNYLVHDGQLPVPGIINGNVFIGLQPARGYEDPEQAEKCYHSTDITCPHQYISFYKWIKHVFKAHAIIHIGTHGTLEWLPGKEKGLSKTCFPSINIDDLPHLYIYHTSVIGEGIQAKRRSSAVLLNHLIPSSTESGTYDELSDLDNNLKEYIQNTKGRQAQQEDLKEQIWNLCLKLSLDVDMNIPKDKMPEDFETFAHDLHSWIEIIKQSNVKDGLHIFGEVPKNERYTNLVRVLVRTRTGNIASLYDGIASALGYNYEDIMACPSDFFSDTETGYMIKDKCIEKGTELILTLSENNYEKNTISSIIQKAFPNSAETGKLHEVLEWICDEVVPRLNRTVEEITNTITGFDAKFVPPGKGGTPTRGNTQILPTGRNMFALDPSAVPSRAAHKVGMRMGDQLIERYIKDEGKLPEAIGIVLYSGDQMRTAGEDIAEVLYLMGVRPKWIGSSNRVNGVELISLEELKRPRLDVTCRISGLFRDTFPMLISLLDDAVKLAAAADEPEEQNFIKKHFNQDIAKLKAKGINDKTARQEALIRVYGCPPGNYGGGVDIMVESKTWNSQEDLADVSVTWSCHAYSNEIHGKVSRDSYIQRLSKIELTVKNENTTDFDIYDIDDEFIYHGGMIAAVTKFSGKKPQSYYGNSSDADYTKVASVTEETARIMRSRLLNPKWIDGLKRHGFKGAQDVAYNMDNVFGWDAVADVVEDWAYEALANHFLFNKENQEWLSKENPWAIHQIAEKLLEAIQRNMWNADENMIEKLKEIYVQTEGNIEGRDVL